MLFITPHLPFCPNLTYPYLLSLQMCLFWAFHKKWSYIIFGLFLANFFYLAPLFSGFIHSCYTCIVTSFFFSSCVVRIYHILFLHSSAKKHLAACFSLLVVMNHTSETTHIQVFRWTYASFFLCISRQRITMGFLGGSVVKNTPAKQETACNAEDLGSIRGLRKFPG